MVAAGLLIGNRGRRLAMSDVTREHLDTFWELVDEVLNAVLFVLIGLELLVLSLEGSYLLAAALAVPAALVARLASVGLPMAIISRWRTHAPRAVTIMTWAGLRGGISVALALSLPSRPGQGTDPDHDLRGGRLFRVPSRALPSAGWYAPPDQA